MTFQTFHHFTRVQWRCGRAEKCVEIRVEQLMNHHYYLEKKLLGTTDLQSTGKLAICTATLTAS